MGSEFSSDAAELEGGARCRVAPSSTNLPLIDELAADEETRALFQQYRDRFGRTELPGIVLCFATHPPLLRGMLEIAGAVLFIDGQLRRYHKEMIATFVSLRNGCPYCADSHAYFLRAQGGSADLPGALRTADLDSPLVTGAERALLRFAGKINAESQAITRSDIEATMQAGWTEAQLAETVHIASLFACFNRIANAFGLPSPYPDLL